MDYNDELMEVEYEILELLAAMRCSILQKLAAIDEKIALNSK